MYDAPCHMLNVVNRALCNKHYNFISNVTFDMIPLASDI